MLGVQGSFNPASSSSPSQAANPETASIASFSSTTALLKHKKESKPASIDVQKLQDQSLKSQVRFCM